MGEPSKAEVMERWENWETAHPGKRFLGSLAAGYNQAAAARLLGVFLTPIPIPRASPPALPFFFFAGERCLFV